MGEEREEERSPGLRLVREFKLKLLFINSFHNKHEESNIKRLKTNKNEDEKSGIPTATSKQQVPSKNTKEKKTHACMF